jgi:predicted glycosyltransferase
MHKQDNSTLSTKKTAWIDIINPPQVKYLTPLAYSLQSRGYNTLITARDFSSTLALLSNCGITPVVIGNKDGSSPMHRLLINLSRAARLYATIKSYPYCEFLITGSRAASLAARVRNIPDFAFCDYEFAEIQSHSLMGSYMVFPSVIPKQFFQDKGFKKERLLSYNGIKEDITFSEVEFAEVKPLSLPDRFMNKRIVLLRPPATESHYYSSHSSSLYQMVLEELASLSNIGLVYSPRYQSQISHLNAFKWATDPFILDNQSDTLALLKAVDLVISSGGTMVREAAYHKVKAISILAGNPCSVDAYLIERGLLRVVRNLSEFRMAFSSSWHTVNQPPRNVNVIQEILNDIIYHAAKRNSQR